MKLPRYRSTTVVSACKIAEISNLLTGHSMIRPDDPDIDPFYVTPDFVRRHKPCVGQYFVRMSSGLDRVYSEGDFKNMFEPIGEEDEVHEEHF